MSSKQLTFVDAQPVEHLNVFLYGPPKTGKTTGAATAPGPILYLNADRPNATRFAHSLRDDLHEATIEDLTTLVAAAELLKSEDGKRFQTVVLDPIGEVYTKILDGLSAKATRPAINLRGDAGVHLERFCKLLCEHPINAVLIAHDYLVEDEESGTPERLPFVTSKSGSPVFAAKLMAMVDVIGYTGVVADEKDEEVVRYMAQLRNGRGRRGGDRFGVLGSAREVNISEWGDLARAATAPKKKAQKER